MPRIRTAVFPVAGRGTRFLPATKASPKEMLPIVDKPLIQYAVEEALDAGAERLVFITGSSKRAIEDHFDTDAELERQRSSPASTIYSRSFATSSRGGDLHLRATRDTARPRACRPLRAGLPSATNPSSCILPTTSSTAKSAVYGRCASISTKHGASVLGVETVPADQTAQLRHRGRARPNRSGAQRVTRIVEKPKPKDAPVESRGRGPLHPDAWHLCQARATQRGAGGEIQLTDGIASLLADEPVHVLARSAVFATTAAARSATYVRPSNTVCVTRSSALTSARTCRTSGNASVSAHQSAAVRRISSLCSPKPWRVTAIGRAVRLEAHRGSDRSHDADQRMLELDDHPARAARARRSSVSSGKLIGPAGIPAATSSSTHSAASRRARICSSSAISVASIHVALRVRREASGRSSAWLRRRGPCRTSPRAARCRRR